MVRPLAVVAAVLALAIGGCGVEASSSAASTPTTPTTTSLPTTTTSTSTTSTSTTTTTTTSTSTSTTSSTTTTVEPLPDPDLPASNAAFDALARSNAAVSITVVRDRRPVLARASGTTIDSAAATSDSPMVIASVSKLVTATMIARLVESGLVDIDVPMPWTELGITTDPAWGDVTPREMLDHSSGMPVARTAWFDGSDDCATFLPALLDRPPAATRGRWTYSNGNYCALGLLVEHVTGRPLDAAAQRLLFDPIGVDGVHLTATGQLPTDIGYRPGVDRLSRLGGAGAFIVSTDDLASMLAAVTPSDLDTMRWPGLIVDQYGWGHTGTVSGALSCAWVLEGGRTVVAVTVAGNSPATGGEVCDRVVPALARDLGIDDGRPDRSPP